MLAVTFQFSFPSAPAANRGFLFQTKNYFTTPLTSQEQYANSIGAMKTYSTVEVARKIKVHKATLLRWLYAGAIPEPRRYIDGGVEVRIWTDRDVERVRKFKAANYRKGRGRKKKPKA